jgi:hypothetical protein
MVEALLDGNPLPSGHLEPGEASALRAAIDLRASQPGADLPEDEFVTGLRLSLDVACGPGEINALRPDCRVEE